MRKIFNKTDDALLKSALFLYLNRHGYNGLCRYNSTGEFNVPFGSHPKIFFPEKEMLFFHEKAQRAIFKCADFNATFKHCRKQDVIYCDPPYIALSQTAHFTQYHKGSFGIEEQIALAKQAEKTSAKGITVVISNHDTDFTREIYANAAITSFPVKRSISCNGKKRKAAQELLAVFS